MLGAEFGNKIKKKKAFVEEAEIYSSHRPVEHSLGYFPKV